ncbi:hypothetical protein RchiOBHm_Chr4g0399091 [Rosa chinensis]|uniref:Uncharacterized protein n=1 Tax=Rosa chinensis TaxID=74649 RepID=A0A2P6QSF7_ROSCH|nr:hypothetical protein RchiOBHm_Chr4g0399091 [Rosa chinensis]
MKDFGRTRLCLGLELEHRVDRCLGIFDKVKPSSTPMIVRSLDPEKDPLRRKDDDEDVLEAKVPYLVQ